MGPGDPWYTLGSQFFKLSCAVDQNKVPVEDKPLGNELATALPLWQYCLLQDLWGGKALSDYARELKNKMMISGLRISAQDSRKNRMFLC